MRKIINIRKDKIVADEEFMNCAPTDSTIPKNRPPRRAPGILPKPPKMTIIKAFVPNIVPI